MKSKVFEYLNKDVPMLRKDIFFRAVSAMMFLTVFVIQIISLIKKVTNHALNIGMIVSSSIVLLVCLLFGVISILYMLKTLRIISVINARGRCVSSVEVLIDTKRDGFTRLYSLVCQILALLATIVLVCSLTYSVLQVSYYSSLSFYLPLLATICLTSYYSVFHLKNELKIAETVNEYHSIY